MTPSRFANTPASRSAFTLVELLVVMSLMLGMMGLIVPAITGMKGAGDLTKSAYDIVGTLEQARAYAMANNTFVFVGIEEVDASKDPSASSQSATTGPAVGGRVAIAMVASKDGTRGYNIAATSNPAWTNYSNGSNLMMIGKLLHLENVHLTATSTDIPATGNLARPTVSTSGTGQVVVLGDSTLQSLTPFDWPLGKASGTGQYSFTKVINFDPQGVARIQTSGSQDSIAKYLEIGLIPTHGKVSSLSNFAAIQVNGMTGATRIYRQ